MEWDVTNLKLQYNCATSAALSKPGDLDFYMKYLSMYLEVATNRPMWLSLQLSSGTGKTYCLLLRAFTLSSTSFFIVSTMDLCSNALVNLFLDLSRTETLHRGAVPPWH